MAYFALNPEITASNVHAFDEFIKKLTMGKDLKEFINVETNVLEELEKTIGKFPSMYELMPDDFYLAKEAMILRYGIEPIFGTNETYLNNEWKFKQTDMQANVTKAMEFKKSLGETLPGKEDDILVIFNEEYPTFDKLSYSGAGIGGEFIYDSGQLGDTIVVKKSAMGSMSGSPYKNSKSIPNSTHLELPNEQSTIDEIANFLKKTRIT